MDQPHQPPLFYPAAKPGHLVFSETAKTAESQCAGANKKGRFSRPFFDSGKNQWQLDFDHGEPGSHQAPRTCSRRIRGQSPMPSDATCQTVEL
jgi:hypothetical protein